MFQTQIGFGTFWTRARDWPANCGLQSRHHLIALGFLMRPQLAGGTLGGQRMSDKGSVERLLRLCAALLVLGCSGRTSTPHEPPSQPMPGEHAGNVVTTEELSLPLPDGYRDETAELSKDGIVLVFAANESSKAYRPTIAVLKVPIPGGSFADPATCAQTGSGLVRGGTDAPGTGGVLTSAAIIDGPVGRTCQIRLVAPAGVAVITELHRPGNTPQNPKEIWLLTCNHADGDDAAEATCRSTLAQFRFRDP